MGRRVGIRFREKDKIANDYDRIVFHRWKFHSDKPER
jgi:hypothetical protein